METKSDIKIRSIEPSEFDQLAGLVLELHDYQKMEVCPHMPNKEDLLEELTHRGDMIDQVVTNKSGTYVCVAIDNSKISNTGRSYLIGYMIYSQMWSVIEGRRIYINSFFIKEEYRRCGVGKKIMAYVREHSSKLGNPDIDVPVMNSNSSGHSFYANYKAYLVNQEYILYGLEL